MVIGAGSVVGSLTWEGREAEGGMGYRGVMLKAEGKLSGKGVLDIPHSPFLSSTHI